MDPRLDDSSDDDFTNLPELTDNEIKASTTEEENTEEVKSSESENKDMEDPDGWEDILGSGRLMKRVVRKGSEDSKPPKGARVTVNVIEKLQETEEEVGKRENLQFNVGESEVEQALDLCLPLISKGEIALVKSEATFMYGDLGDGSRVPPSSAMLLEVELLDWAELGAPPDIPLDQRAGIGNTKRERGNKWFSRGEYSLAVQCYRKAAEYLDDKQIEEEMEVPIDRHLLPQPLQQLLEDRVKTFNNMAQAQMKLTAWDSALVSVRQVLKIQPNNEKALYRKAKILQEKCQLDEAIGILRRINRLYPANKQCHAELTRLTGKLKSSREKEQLMSRKMLGLDKLPEKKSNFFSRQARLILATVGGLGALAGAMAIKQYYANGL